jgi:hypothetical protein
MKKTKTDPRFNKYNVDCIVDGLKNIIILRPKAEFGVYISWKIPHKKNNLVTNFFIIGNDYHNKKDQLKYKLLLIIIGILYPKYEIK